MTQAISWSIKQKDIINNCNTNTYIAAGPGSGKSTTLSGIAEEVLKVSTNKLMLLTFTNKAAKSILNKVSSLDKTKVIGGTFHSICYRLLKESGNDFNICDETKKRLIIKRLFNCRKDKDVFDEKYESISNAKATYPETKSEDLTRYNEELSKYNMLDFDDLISRGIHLFSTRTRHDLGITHILVDELQDTSQAQLELIKAIQLSTKAIIIGVGDDDQCIYEWRSARYKNVEDFIKVFKCTIKELGVNYRSVVNIVSRSKRLIEKNTKRIKKDLTANTTDYGTILPSSHSDPIKEIDWIVSKCRLSVAHKKEVAILYRNRSNKMRLEFELKKAGLEYKVNDSTDISDRSSFRVLICLLRIACRNYDIYDLEEAIKGLKKIGSTTVEKIKAEHIKTGQHLDEVIIKLRSESKRIKTATTQILTLQSTFDKLGKSAGLNILLKKLPEFLNDSYDMNLEVYSFLVDITKDYKCTVTDIRLLCNEFGLEGKEQRVENDKAFIELSTVHGYKGLERDVVMLPFCNSYLDLTKKRINIEEERRIFYVAFTRAKESVYLSYCGATPIFIKELGF